ncbi:MAG: hypothetical protein B6244_02505 [Candidatus Cloacimonetes bacterium 4572_55]|nr:MAG: hypothetical protein B6244_02505 [Candidatus Cloacimonetes bacterium 4572_55]
MIRKQAIILWWIASYFIWTGLTFANTDKISGAHDALQLRQEAIRAFPEYKSVLSGEGILDLKSPPPSATLSRIDSMVRGDESQPFGNPYLSYLKGHLLLSHNFDASYAAFAHARDAARDHSELHWDLAKLYEMNGQYDLLESELSQLYQIKLNNGAKVDPIFFNLAIYKGDGYQKIGDIDTALLFYEFAKKMDPSSIIPYMKLTKMLLANDFGEALSNFLGIFMTFKESLPLQLFLSYRILQYLIYGLYFGLLAVVIIATLKSLPKYQHIIFEMLPSRASSIIREGVAWILVLSPILFGFGLTGYVLLGMAVTWYFYTNPEKIVGIVLLVYLLIFPHLLATHYALFTSMSDRSVVRTIWNGQHNVYDPDVRNRLARLLEKDSSDSDANFALGLIHKRRGASLIRGKEEKNLTPSQDRLRDQERERGKKELSLSKTYFDNAVDAYPARAANNIGNIFYARQIYEIQNRKKVYFEKAIEKYESAIRGKNDLARPYFNKSQVLNMLARWSEMDEPRRKALTLDPSLTYILDKVEPHCNRVVLDESIPLSAFWSRVGKEFRLDADLLTPLWIGGIKGLPVTKLPALAGIIFLLMEILSFWIKGWEKLSACSVCGRVISPTSRRRVKENVLCHRCYRTVAGTKLDAMRFALLARIRRLSTQREYRTAVFLSFIYPGSGQLYRDDHKFGLPLIFIFSVHITTLIVFGLIYSFTDQAVVIYPTLQRPLPNWLGFGYLITVGLASLIVSAAYMIMQRPGKFTAKDLQDEMEPTETHDKLD